MALWLLKPKENLVENYWDNPYDKQHGFVIRAQSETEARRIAQENAAQESFRESVWLDPTITECTQVQPEGNSALILEASA